MTGIPAALACAASWAIGSVSMKKLSQKLDPFTLNAPRSAVAGIAMLLMTLCTDRVVGYSQVTPMRLFLMLASILIGAGIGDSLYVASFARIGVSQAFPISSTYPALTLLFGFLFLQEQVTWPLVAGLVLVLGGVILMGGSTKKLNGHLDPKDRRTGLTFALAAALLWAVSTVLIAPGVEGLDPVMVASIRIPALSLVLWGITIRRGTVKDLWKLSWREWLTIILGGLIGWGVGSVTYVTAVSALGATRSAVLTSTSPLFALPLSVLFAQEKINWLTIVGTIVTVGGIILVS